ncbi:MAG: potassium/proton antiporter [Spirochaetae bacterium HGW-Spirochaetae-9]|nr:MAG: potassium/proton antiporter [Spirochaetae bacterium HGW-Spirochaetae-9]
MLLTGAVILIFLTLSAAIFRRFNVPMIILALAVGIFFGSDVTGIIYFDDALLTRRLADIALVFVLFAGGYSIKRADLKPVLAPTMMLATLGVLITMIVTALVFHLVSGWSFTQSLLVATVISSTDAAAVFSILRNRSLQLRPSSITEIESAANDPMAIIATTLIIQIVAGGEIEAGRVALSFVWQLLGGVGIGLGVGWAGLLLFRKIKEVETGYYYLLLIGLILASYGAADLVGASGMLSAFFAGFLMGNSKLPLKSSLSSFTATLSFVANAGLFILLGLLMFPRSMGAVWSQGLLLFLILSFVARPVAVFFCTLGMKLPFGEKIFLSWSGIRGSVPIVLATYPAAAGLDPDHQIFNIIFLAVTLSILVQGTTIGKLADLLKLSEREKPKNKQKMELVTVHDTKYELVELFIDGDLYKGESTVASLVLPADATITMISRKDKIIAPRGNTMLHPGDILTILVDEGRITEVTNHVLSKFEKQ